MQGHGQFMQMAIALATENVRIGHGGPFGAVIVRDGEVIASGVNQVSATNDPTAHAEITCLRNACTKLSVFELTNCVLYSSCEPCPMCLAAIYWARCAALFYGNTAQDAAEAGFDDAHLYEQIRRPVEGRDFPSTNLMREEALESFSVWSTSIDRINY